MDIAGFKKSFFDKAAVTAKLPPAIRKALSKFGAFTRRTAKNSLKYGDKSSKPGRPPTVHRSKGYTKKSKKKGRVVLQPASPLRELIFFGFEAEKESVVIGPAIGGSKSGAPEKLEHGRFPFMQPAFDKELGGAAGNFKNLIV